MTHTTELIPADLLKNLSESVLSGARSYVGVSETVRRLPGDIVVALSDADFVSFTVGAPSMEKVLIGIKSHLAYPLTLSNVTRNVIAHELGHAIGLGHNADPTKLMCGRPAPCRLDAFSSSVEHFFPLTGQEGLAFGSCIPQTGEAVEVPAGTDRCAAAGISCLRNVGGALVVG